MIVGYLRTEQAKAAGVSLEEINPTQDWSPYMEGDVKAGEPSSSQTDTLAVSAIRFMGEVPRGPAAK